MNDVSEFYIHIFHLFTRLNQDVEKILNDLNYDLSFSQYTLLAFISTQKEHRISQKQLNEWSSLRGPSISQLLKVLEEKEYIHRYLMSRDSRCKEMTLTDKALQHLKEIDKKMKMQLLQKMTKEELSSSVLSLQFIKEAIEREE